MNRIITTEEFKRSTELISFLTIIDEVEFQNFKKTVSKKKAPLKLFEIENVEGKVFIVISAK